jgi:hypothetical protein
MNFSSSDPLLAVQREATQAVCYQPPTLNAIRVGQEVIDPMVHFDPISQMSLGEYFAENLSNLLLFTAVKSKLENRRLHASYYPLKSAVNWWIGLKNRRVSHFVDPGTGLNAHVIEFLALSKPKASNVYPTAQPIGQIDLQQGADEDCPAVVLLAVAAAYASDPDHREGYALAFAMMCIHGHDAVFPPGRFGVHGAKSSVLMSEESKQLGKEVIENIRSVRDRTSYDLLIAQASRQISEIVVDLGGEREQYADYLQRLFNGTEF